MSGAPSGLPTVLRLGRTPPDGDHCSGKGGKNSTKGPSYYHGKGGKGGKGSSTSSSSSMSSTSSGKGGKGGKGSSSSITSSSSSRKATKSHKCKGKSKKTSSSKSATTAAATTILEDDTAFEVDIDDISRGNDDVMALQGDGRNGDAHRGPDDDGTMTNIAGIEVRNEAVAPMIVSVFVLFSIGVAVVAFVYHRRRSRVVSLHRAAPPSPSSPLSSSEFIISSGGDIVQSASEEEAMSLTSNPQLTFESIESVRSTSFEDDEVE